MNLRFDPDNEAAFEVARDRIVDGLGGWLREQDMGEEEAGELAHWAGNALDWKWGYSDGDLAVWRRSHVSEYLLDYCPRKVAAPAAACAALPAGLMALLVYLDETGLRDQRTGPLSALVEALEESTPDFFDAMDDPGNFGPGKAIATAMGTDGVDFTDETAVAAWIEEFNSRPGSERAQVIPGPDHDDPEDRQEPVRLPPVAAPDPEAVAASVAAAPVLEDFRRLAEFFGDGRPLTQKGNIRLADARTLGELLGTGDLVDEVIGDRTFKTKSSDDLPVLRRLFAWAKKAGVLRIIHGKALATKRAATLGRDPEWFRRAFDALLDIGPVTSIVSPTGWGAWPEVAAFVDEHALDTLSLLYACDAPLPLAEVTDLLADEVMSAFRFAAVIADDTITSRVGCYVADMMNAFEHAGVLVRDGWDEASGRRRLGGTARLTPAGVQEARRQLLEAGCEAPTTGRHTGSTATALIRDLSDAPWAEFFGELRAWQRERTEEEAAADLAAAALALTDPAMVALAFGGLTDLGAEASEAHVRKLAGEPRLRSDTAVWLVDMGCEPLESLWFPDDLDTFVGVLAQRFLLGGMDCEALLETLALAGDPVAQAACVESLWRSSSGAVTSVLEAIATVHPDKAVAKAARKALFRARSVGGGGGGRGRGGGRAPPRPRGGGRPGAPDPSSASAW